MAHTQEPFVSERNRVEALNSQQVLGENQQALAADIDD